MFPVRSVSVSNTILAFYKRDVQHIFTSILLYIHETETFTILLSAKTALSVYKIIVVQKVSFILRSRKLLQYNDVR